MFDSLKNKFQLRFKNRIFAAKILAGALEDSLGKMKLDKKKDTLLILGISREGRDCGRHYRLKATLQL